MASDVYQEHFEDIDLEEVSEGFSREELEQARPVLNQPDDDEQSVHEYSSKSEESETSEDKEAPLTNNKPTTTSIVTKTEPGVPKMTVQWKTEKKFGQRHLRGQTCLSISRFLNQKLF